MKYTITTKLLIVLLGLATVLLAVTASIAIYTTKKMGNTALKELKALEQTGLKQVDAQAQEREITFFRDLTIDYAYGLELQMGQEKDFIKVVAGFVEKLWHNPSLFRLDRTSYSMDEQPDDVTQFSVYKLASHVTLEDVRSEVQLSTNLDDLFIPVHEHWLKRESSIYIGTESGFVRGLPWNRSHRYDPKTRPWYQRAAETQQPGFTGMYEKIGSGELTFTLSTPFYSSDGEFLGVVGMDYGWEDVKSAFFPSSLLQELNIFGILINNTGKIFATSRVPEEESWTAALQNGVNLSQCDNLILQAMIQRMLREKTFVYEQCVLQDSSGCVQSAGYYLKEINWGIVLFRKFKDRAENIREQIRTAAQRTETGIDEQSVHLQTALSILLVIMIVSVIGLSYTFSRRLTHPIIALHQGAEAVGKGNLDYKIAVRSGDEFEGLAQAFNTMTDDLKQHIHELAETTAAKKKFETEFEIARTIQASLLPEKLPQIPGWEIAACVHPAREVAGDFYDVFPLKNSHHIFFVIADVCDKGVGPALFAAVIRTLLRAFSLYSCGEDLKELPVELTNTFIVENQADTGMFATLFAGVLDSDSGVLRYINCGHNPPCILSSVGKMKACLELTSPALCLFPRLEYDIGEVRLDAGDMLFAFTDGLPDAQNADDEFFGNDRLLQLLQQPAFSAAEMLALVMTSVRAHIADADPFDDITILVIQREGEGSEEKNEMLGS